MSEINVKQIRKAAELLGMKPKDLIENHGITVDEDLIKKEIKSDFEEKVAILLKFRRLIKPFAEKIISTRKEEVSFLKTRLNNLILGFILISIIFLILIVVSVNYVTAILFISLLLIAIIIFGLILSKIIYNKIIYENKSPQRYAIEELVKIIEIIDQQEKY